MKQQLLLLSILCYGFSFILAEPKEKAEQKSTQNSYLLSAKLTGSACLTGIFGGLAYYCACQGFNSGSATPGFEVTGTTATLIYTQNSLPATIYNIVLRFGCSGLFCYLAARQATYTAEYLDQLLEEDTCEEVEYE